MIYAIDVKYHDLHYHGTMDIDIGIVDDYVIKPAIYWCQNSCMALAHVRQCRGLGTREADVSMVVPSGLDWQVVIFYAGIVHFMVGQGSYWSTFYIS